jgi:hypothetical protein
MTDKKCCGCCITFPLDVLTLLNDKWFCLGCFGEFDKEDE